MLNPRRTKKQRQYLRNNMTKWEIRLWNDLKQKKMLGFKVRRQYGVNNYVIDFIVHLEDQFGKRAKEIIGN